MFFSCKLEYFPIFTTIRNSMSQKFTNRFEIETGVGCSFWKNRIFVDFDFARRRKLEGAIDFSFCCRELKCCFCGKNPSSSTVFWSTRPPFTSPGHGKTDLMTLVRQHSCRELIRWAVNGEVIRTQCGLIKILYKGLQFLQALSECLPSHETFHRELDRI